MTKQLPYHETNQCVQCGYCLPVCPTYKTMGKETHSPRGRINLVKMAAEGRISIDELSKPIDLCLGCRACETACPSGVEYGVILENTREVLYQHKNENTSKTKRWVQDTLFKKVFPNLSTLQYGTDLIWLYQRSGLQKLAHKTNLSNVFLPENIAAFEKVLPNATSPKERRNRPRIFQSRNGGPTNFKVAFFTGCIMDAIFERINRLSMELLALAGCEVHVIKEQTCCGALHAHTGRKEDTLELAKANIMAFEDIEVDFIVNNAGGCGAMLIEYQQLFKGNEEWEKRAEAFVQKARDISQILDQCELPFQYSINEVVTYQRSCHMTHVQKVTQEPLSLIKKVPGITFREMENPHLCCGSAGIYNVVNYDESMEILNLKMKTTKETKATIVVTTNPGCLLQMKLGVELNGLTDEVRTVHLVELLAESVGLVDKGGK